MREMEACWPSGVGPAGAGIKPPCAALVEDRRGERLGKRRGCGGIASGGDQEDVPESPCSLWVSLLTRRKFWMASRASTAAVGVMSLAGARVPWPGGVRRVGGVSLVCGSCTEREKANVDMAIGVAGPRGRERERANAGHRRC